MNSVASVACEDSSERINFDVHSNLISDLIYSQNGTVATAIRELVMNAIDAGSQSCDIKLHRKGFSVIDRGKGFESEESIKTYFKNFGEPHSEGDAEFGRFRIGRGQIMAFGPVKWTSNFYSMHVDTKKNGFSFDFTSFNESQWEGCRVDGEFYKELHSSEIFQIKDELQDFIGFSDIKVTFNGDSLNRPISDIDWDVEDEDFLIQWKGSSGLGGIKLYSKGVYVKTINSYHYGFEARIVTKKALVLNMARNEVTDTDPLWMKIAETLLTKSKEVARQHGKGGRIDTATRRSAIRLFLGGQLGEREVHDLCLLKDCRGHSFSLGQMVRNRLPLTISPESGSRKAERVASSRMAQVLHSSVPNEFRVGSIFELIEKIVDTIYEYYYGKDRYLDSLVDSYIHEKQIVEFDYLADKMVDESKLYPKSKHTLREAAARNALQYGSTVLAKGLSRYSEFDIKKRNILLGESDVADGWTNGRDTIVVGRHMLKCLDTLSRGGGYQLALLLLHEYLHSEDDSGSHVHDFEFMTQFHDIASDYRNDIVGSVANGIYQRYLKELIKKNLDLPKKIKGEFKYPIINDVKRIELTVATKKLDDLTKTVLDWIGLPYKKEKGKIIVTTNYEKLSPNYVYLHFYRVARKNDKELKDLEFYEAVHNRKEAFGFYCEAVAKSLSQLVDEKYQDDSLFLELVKGRGVYDWLSALCKSDYSGARFFTVQNFGTTKWIHNHKVSYSHSIGSHFPEQSYGDNRYLQSHSSYLEFASSKSGRLRYAKQIIEHAFLGLKSEDERSELAEQLLSENGKESLLSIMELPSAKE